MLTASLGYAIGKQQCAQHNATPNDNIPNLYTNKGTSPLLPNTLDFAGEKVPLDVYYVREALDKELIINCYQHSKTIQIIKRSARYFPVIEPILKEEGVPEDFKYLCVAESGLENVTSPANAGGYWQFIPGTAKVYGLAREVVQSRTELQWELLRTGSSDGPKEKTVSFGRSDTKCYYTRFNEGETPEFTNRERVFLKFRAPANGFVVVYLIEGDDETSCLLPYRNSPFGRMEVIGGRDYLFFDKRQDPQAPTYYLQTQRPSEDNQFVIIYSPHPFNKCNDVSNDPLHPNSLNTHDFQKWLLSNQRHDREMVVNKQWVRIVNPNAGQ